MNALRAPGRSVVIGIGNPFRHDDGVGPAVVERLRPSVPGGVDLAVVDGDPVGLLDAWAERDLAVVVDAVRGGGAPGTVHRTAFDAAGAPHAGASTHGLGLPDVLRLARALGRAPGRLVVLGVEACELGVGVGLSPPVAAALPQVVAAALRELEGCGSEAGRAEASHVSR